MEATISENGKDESAGEDKLSPPQTVLVVDDDPLVHAMAEAFLASIGTRAVLSALDGAAGLRLLDDERDAIDLVLCDLNMPGVDGLQFLRHLMERRFRKPVIIISGENQDIVRAAQNLAEAHDLNVIGRISKPLRAEPLRAVLAAPQQARTGSKRFSAPVVSESDLKAALRQSEIKAFFQPKLDLASGEIGAAEALARWFHPDFGLIMPDTFVPMAEQAGLIPDLTACIFDQALEIAKTCKEKGIPLHVAVNTDAHTLSQLGFPDNLAERTGRSGVHPSMLTLEITERSILSEGAASIEVLTRLRMMHFGISIDDFGTGYSNIKQLCTYPFSELKVDKSFLRGIDSDETKLVCLNAVIALGKALGLRIVAEGIETESDLDLIRRAGVDEAQGYRIARPMPADEFVDWLAEASGMAA